MIDGVKLAGDVEADYAEVDQAELKMRKLVDMWGHMKIGDHTDLSVALVCPICPDQVLYPADYEQMLLNRERLENVQFTITTPSIQHL